MELRGTKGLLVCLVMVAGTLAVTPTEAGAGDEFVEYLVKSAGAVGSAVIPREENDYVSGVTGGCPNSPQPEPSAQITTGYFADAWRLTPFDESGSSARGVACFYLYGSFVGHDGLEALEATEVRLNQDANHVQIWMKVVDGTVSLNHVGTVGRIYWTAYL